jgi:hypothetical protein
VQPGDRLAGFGDLMGDYNGDGQVNAADYIVYRNNQGLVTNLFNGLADPDSGEIDLEDYDYWASNFGNMSGGGSATVVPEPTALMILLVALAPVVWQRMTPRVGRSRPAVQQCAVSVPRPLCERLAPKLIDALDPKDRFIIE